MNGVGMAAAGSGCDGEVIGIKQIAKLAGVSTATVSRVINHRPGVRPALRQVVEETIRLHGLHLDAAARALKSRRTKKLAVIVPGRGDLVFSNPFFGEILRGITSVTEDAGYGLVLITNASPHTLEEVNRNRSCDAVILIGFRKGLPEPRSLKGATVPVVTIPQPGPRYRLPFVSVQDEVGAYDVVNHLIDRGHARIALVSGPPTNIFSMNRLSGYRTALKNAGIRFDPSIVKNASYTREGALQVVSELLDLPKPPTAIFATSDYMAIGAMEAIRSRGLRIPDDVALVGFGNTPICDLLTPKLTTVDERLHQLGSMSASLAIQFCHGDGQFPTQITLDTRLIVRESS